MNVNSRKRWILNLFALSWSHVSSCLWPIFNLPFTFALSTLRSSPFLKVPRRSCWAQCSTATPNSVVAGSMAYSCYHTRWCHTPFETRATSEVSLEEWGSRALQRNWSFWYCLHCLGGQAEVCFFSRCWGSHQENFSQKLLDTGKSARRFKGILWHHRSKLYFQLLWLIWFVECCCCIWGCLGLMFA